MRHAPPRAVSINKKCPLVAKNASALLRCGTLWREPCSLASRDSDEPRSKERRCMGTRKSSAEAAAKMAARIGVTYYASDCGADPQEGTGRDPACGSLSMPEGAAVAAIEEGSPGCRGSFT
ncbi:hypothetical protein NDU88_005382 [Pleurodeles waltl]|uniref:Uncharacterized protein n=1 Tax=Pleurodeles waltl TaxID=8319 RepID=A0AAV7TWZ2_PLEWA|nr:hypothetical protein NDU88_005382 [Pleurodeles waltl]